MLTPWEFLIDLTNPALAFLPRALVVTVSVATVCAVVGTHVALRGLAFVGDAVTHSVFPGLAVAFVLGGSLVLGGLIAGVVTAVVIALLSSKERVGEQNIIGVLLTSMFALGVVILSFVPGYTASLSSFLFGSITGIPHTEMYWVVATCTAIVLAMVALQRYLVAAAFEPESARAAGVPVLAYNVALYVMVALAVVVSVRSIGNILVLALLITPAATARLYCERLSSMMVVAAGCGALSAFVGMYLSWSLDLPTGASIVLTASGLFVLSWLFAPRHGAVASLRTLRAPAT